jgi:Domain of unknown function (DUF6089)
MQKILVLVCFGLFTHTAFSQRFHIGVFGGLAAYNGDLTDKIFPKKVTNGAIGITGNYELTDNIMLRGGFTYCIVGGADRFSNDAELRSRNLAFETSISEFSVVGEYYLLNLYDNRISPYAFAGLALYHFNPYAFNGTTDKIFLKPLSTEGQGLPGYPDRKPYGLTQAAIPFGGGVKFAITDNLHVGLEVGFRKLFTDYLDDVSTTYVDPSVFPPNPDGTPSPALLLSDRSYETGPPIGVKGRQRGNSQNKDQFVTAMFYISFNLQSYRCPTAN